MYVNSKICVYKISPEDHGEIVSPKEKSELFGIECLVCAKPRACDTHCVTRDRPTFVSL